MLQQTQVKTVLRYYSKFIQKFPTIESLAISRQETVLKSWEDWVIIKGYKSA